MPLIYSFKNCLEHIDHGHSVQLYLRNENGTKKRQVSSLLLRGQTKCTYSGKMGTKGFDLDIKFINRKI